jgi:hypothetical protein
MENLRTADCCHSCKHCTLTAQHDDWPNYWCNQTGAFEALESARQEYYMDDDFDTSKFWSLEELLNTVTKPYNVFPSNTCDRYERKERLWIG